MILESCVKHFSIVSSAFKDIEKRLTVSHLTVERAAEILWGIKAIPVKTAMRIVYGSQSDEAIKSLKEIGITPLDRILVGTLPESV